MTRFQRRFYYAGAIFVFVVLAPLVVFYAVGYRVDVSQWSVYRTGVVVVASTPRGARVSIDGVDVGRTPIRVEHLKPDSYAVAVDQEGFSHWEKQLTVRASEAVIVDDIMLFPTSLSVTPLNRAAPTATFVSPTRRASISVEAISRGGDSKVTWYLNDTASDTVTFTGSLADVQWNQSERDVAIVTKTGEASYDLFLWSRGDGVVPVILDEKLRTHPRTTWVQNQPLVLAVQRDRSVTFHNVGGDTRRSSVVLDPEDQLLHVHGADLYSVNPNDGTVVRVDTSRTPHTRTTVQHVDPGTYGTSVSLTPSLAVVLRSSPAALLAIDTSTRDAHFIVHEMLSAYTAGLQDGRWLAWSSYDLVAIRGDRERTLLTRVSDPISTALWLPGHAYAVFLAGQTLTAIEFDPRDRRNQSVLLEQIDSLLTFGQNPLTGTVIRDGALTRVTVFP